MAFILSIISFGVSLRTKFTYQRIGGVGDGGGDVDGLLHIEMGRKRKNTNKKQTNKGHTPNIDCKHCKQNILIIICCQSLKRKLVISHFIFIKIGFWFRSIEFNGFVYQIISCEKNGTIFENILFVCETISIELLVYVLKCVYQRMKGDVKILKKYICNVFPRL